MKKSFPANINGRIFYIDEDAFELLNNYLEQLRRAFPGQEGEEIVADIEGRISEILSETTVNGQGVVNISTINEIIEKMGRPSDISAGEDEEDIRITVEAHATGEETAHTPPPFNTTKENAGEEPTHKRLYRNMQDKVFGGVLSGLATYLGWNANILRLLVIVLALCTKLLPLALIYLIAWMIIPAAVSPKQILEMHGKAVTVDSVGQTILGTHEGMSGQDEGFFTTLFKIIGKVCLILAIVVAGSISLGMLALFIVAFCGIIIFAGWGSVELISELGMFNAASHPIMGSVGILTLSLSILIPCLAAVWGCISTLTGRQTATKTSAISIFIIELLLIITTVILLSAANVTNTMALTALTSGVCVMQMC